MSSKEGFFSTLFSICSGTEIFPELTKRSFGAAIGQFLLLVLLVSLLGGAGAWWRINSEMEGVRNSVILSFGKKLLVSEKGILPEKQPDLARSLELPGNGRIFYAGVMRKKQSEPLELAGLDYFIYWQAGMPALAVRNEDNSWNVARLGENELFKKENSSSDALERILEESDDQLWREKLPPEIPVGAIFDYIVLILGLTFFLREFILFVIFGSVLTGMISFIFSLSRYGNREWLKYWKVCLYSGFPAVIVAGFFPLLDLPFFDFTDVFAVGLVIYHFAALRRVLQDSNAPSSPLDKGGKES